MGKTRNTGYLTNIISYDSSKNISLPGNITAIGNIVSNNIISAIGGNSTNWNASYSWGNHGLVGYLLSSQYNAGDILSKIKSVDGSSSGLDADLLDGYHASAFAQASSLSNYLPLSGGIVSGDIIPSIDNVYSLGSATKMWKDVYIGPGSLYVNGKKVIEDVSDTMNITTSLNQNLSIKTSGTGTLQLSAVDSGNVEINAMTGLIQLKGSVMFQAGKLIRSSDGSALLIDDDIQFSLGQGILGNLNVSGVVSATGGNSNLWNTAYGWGNHATVGYLTSTSLGNYLPLTGGTLTGNLITTGYISSQSSIYIATGNQLQFDLGVTNSYNIYKNSNNLNFSSVGNFIFNNNIEAPNFIGNLNGNANTSSNSTKWNNYENDFSTRWTSGDSLPMYDAPSGKFKYALVEDLQGWLGLGSNAYSSTQYLPLTGGTLTGPLTVNATNIKIVDTLTLGLASEISGQLINYGTNFSQLGNRDVTKAGGFFRIDTRVGYESEFFNVKFVPANGSEQTIFNLSTTGNLNVSGVVSATGGNSNLWNTAYGWGNHIGLYSPLSHTHTFDSLSSKPTTLSGYGITDASLNTHNHDLNYLPISYTDVDMDVYFGDKNLLLGRNIGGWESGTKPAGSHNGFGILHVTTHTGGYATQFGFDSNQNKMWVRSRNPSTWGDWQNMWTSADFTQTNISNWNSAASWGNHATVGYLTSAAPISGSGNYIQNQNSSAQSANMWISGNISYEGSIFPRGAAVSDWYLGKFNGGNTIDNALGANGSFRIGSWIGGIFTSSIDLSATGAATFASTVTAPNFTGLASKASELSYYSFFDGDLNSLNTLNSFKVTQPLSSATNMFPYSNNANALLSMDMYDGSSTYMAQLGFNYQGDIYSRVGISMPWNKLYHTGNLTNPIQGTLASGYIPKATGSGTLENSRIVDHLTNNSVLFSDPSPTIKRMMLYNNNWEAGIQVDSGKIQLLYGGTNIGLTLEDNGSVYIPGNITSNNVFTVSAGNQPESRIRLNNITSVGNRSFDLVAGINSIGQDGFSIFDTVANATRFVIDNAGNVGFGTTNPLTILDIRSSGSGNLGSVITLNRIGAWGSAYSGLKLNMDDGGTNSWNVGLLATSDDSFNIGINGNSFITTLTSGNVGFGTTTPGKKITVRHGDSDGIRIEYAGNEDYLFLDSSNINAHNGVLSSTLRLNYSGGRVAIGSIDNGTDTFQVNGSGLFNGNLTAQSIITGTILLNRSMEVGTIDKIAVGFGGDGYLRWSQADGIKSFLGLGSNAYNSTPYLPLSGGTLNGQLYTNSGIEGQNNPLLTGFILDTHPESATTVIPFMHNDIAYLTKRGGSATDNLGTVNPALFDGTPSYVGFDMSVLASHPEGYVIEMNLHRTFNWSARIGVSFGAGGWRSNYIKIETFDPVTNVYSTVYENASNTKQIIQAQGVTNGPNGISKIRMTFNDFNGGFRIAQIWLLSYDSIGIKETVLGKDGGTLFGSINTTDGYIDFTNSTWGNTLRVGGNGHTDASKASVVTTNGNLHLDTKTGGATYINYYAGNGIIFGGGSGNTVASIDSVGQFWKGGVEGAGNKYIYESGTWGINITGQAASLYGLSISNSTFPATPDIFTSNHVGYISGVSLFGQGDGGIYSSYHTGPWQHQIFGDFRSGQIAVRGKNNDVWQEWRTVWDSGNLTNNNQLSNGAGYLTSYSETDTLQTVMSRNGGFTNVPINSSNSIPLVTRFTGTKSFIMIHSDDSLHIAPSSTVDTDDWNYANQFRFHANGSLYANSFQGNLIGNAATSTHSNTADRVLRSWGDAVTIGTNSTWILGAQDASRFYIYNNILGRDIIQIDNSTGVTKISDTVLINGANNDGIHKLNVSGAVQFDRISLNTSSSGLGFNRRVNDGFIYDNTKAAFQIQQSTDTLQFQVYGAGSFDFLGNISTTGNLGIYGNVQSGFVLDVHGASVLRGDMYALGSTNFIDANSVNHLRAPIVNIGHSTGAFGGAAINFAGQFGQDFEIAYGRGGYAIWRQAFVNDSMNWKNNPGMSIMYSDNSGKVGISGNTAPYRDLHVGGAGATFRVGPYYAGDDRDYIDLLSGGQVSRVETSNEQFLIDNIGGGFLALQSQSSQRLLVGTTTDNGIDKVQVAGGILSTYGRFTRTGNLVTSLFLGDNTIYDNIYQLQFGSDSTNQMGVGPYTASRGVFARQGLGIHINSDDEFTIKSSGWTNLFGVKGGTGDVWSAGSVTASNFIGTLNGYNVQTSVGASSIVARDTNGYIYGVYFNSNRPDENSSAASYIYDVGDGWMRKKSLSNVRSEIISGGGTYGINITGTANDALYVAWSGVMATPDTLAGYGISETNLLHTTGNESKTGSLLVTISDPNYDVFIALSGVTDGNGSGVYGESNEGDGVYGYSPNGNGVYGRSIETYGVFGYSINSAGVTGSSTNSCGVTGYSSSGTGALIGISSSSSQPIAKFQKNSIDKVVINGDGSITSSGNITSPNFIGPLTGNASTATNSITANSSIKFMSTSHASSGFYLENNWDGSYWNITSNYGSPVRVGFSDSTYKLRDVRYINGVAFDGTSNILLTNTSLYSNNIAAETGRNSHSNGIYAYNTHNASLGGSTPQQYWSVLDWGNGAGGSAQLATSWAGGNDIWFRSLRNTENDWWSWKEILHSNNVGKYSPSLTGTGASGNWNINSVGVVAVIGGSTEVNLVHAQIADNDYFRIRVGGTASNAGWAEIATADDGNEPIYVRQYLGTFGSLVRSATLLDEGGNTSFPGAVTASSFNGNASSASKLDNLYAYTNGSDGWFRTTGNAGWYNATHSTGIYSDKAGEVRTYNGADFVSEGNVYGNTSIFNSYKASANDGQGYGFWTAHSSVFGILMSDANNGTYGGRISGDTSSDYNMYFNMAGVNQGYVFKTAGVIHTSIQTNSIRTTGDVVAFASSDRRLKDNIKPIENAMEKIAKIGGYEFDWNDNQDVYKGHDVGVIAQEVEEVLPEVVTTRKNGYKAVKYEKMIALLIQGMKEQQLEIDGLKRLINNKN